nr:uncharacterized protein LOC109425337 [Aedes albopictus]
MLASGEGYAGALFIARPSKEKLSGLEKTAAKAEIIRLEGASITKICNCISNWKFATLNNLILGAVPKTIADTQKAILLVEPAAAWRGQSTWGNNSGRIRQAIAGALVTGCRYGPEANRLHVQESCISTHKLQCHTRTHRVHTHTRKTPYWGFFSCVCCRSRLSHDATPVHRCNNTSRRENHSDPGRCSHSGLFLVIGTRDLGIFRSAAHSRTRASGKGVQTKRSWRITDPRVR